MDERGEDTKDDDGEVDDDDERVLDEMGEDDMVGDEVPSPLLRLRISCSMADKDGEDAGAIESTLVRFDLILHVTLFEILN